MLLQILEEGKLTDSLGVSVDFRNTIIIMTSNVGAADVNRKGVGFGSSGGQSLADYEMLKSRLEDSAKKHFKPEFINRIDEIIVFHQLEKVHLREIVDLEFEKIIKRLNKHHIDLLYGTDVKDFLIERGFKPEYGARPLRRTVERYIEDPLAEKILQGDLKDGTTLRLLAGEDELIFETEDLPEGQKVTSK